MQRCASRMYACDQNPRSRVNSRPSRTHASSSLSAPVSDEDLGQVRVAAARVLVVAGRARGRDALAQRPRVVARDAEVVQAQRGHVGAPAGEPARLLQRSRRGDRLAGHGQDRAALHERVRAVGVRARELEHPDRPPGAALGLARLAEQEQVARQPHEATPDGRVVAQRGEAPRPRRGQRARRRRSGARCRAPSRTRRASRRARAARARARAAAASRGGPAPGDASPPRTPRAPPASRTPGSPRRRRPRRHGA